jgi:hypothetical protein
MRFDVNMTFYDVFASNTFSPLFTDFLHGKE